MPPGSTPTTTPPRPATVGPFLLVGDAAYLEAPLREALGPHVPLTCCPTWFDAIGHLTRGSYAAVFLPVEPVQRRPADALAALRDSAGSARLIALAKPAHEGLARQLLTLGCDDYLIAPVTPADVAAALRLTPTPIHPAPTPTTPPPAATPPPATPLPAPTARSAAPSTAPASPSAPPPAGGPFTLAGLAVAEIVLEALVREPQNAAAAALRELNARLPVGARLELAKVTDRDPIIPPGTTLLSRVLRTHPPHPPVPERLDPLITPPLLNPAANDDPDFVLHLFLADSFDETAASAFVDQVALQICRVLQLQARHCRLQKLAITDELTGLYNARYFRHFLERTLVKAREGRFPVTLLLFDIDSFKTYNDSYGHAVGDEILRQTARMIRRCVRDHDLVARLGGDEFAVVFWEKDGPRQVLQASPDKPVSHRPPQSPVMVFERFKRMIAGHDFAALGPSGRGTLTISGGLAVFPYDAQNADDLIQAADQALMFGAKKSGKNTIHLVGQAPDPP